jgi:hypothetical protein
VNRARVEAQLRNLEGLLHEPRPLLSLVILEYGPGVMVAHPRLDAAQNNPEQAEAALRLIRAELVDLAAYFDREIERVIRASAVPRG